MDIRGSILEIDEKTTTETKYGKRDFLELILLSDGEEITLRLWGGWVDMEDYLGSGTELLATNVKQSSFQGKENYSTTGDSYVVLEPFFLVDVTEIRAWVQCPRMHYLNKISGTPLKYPVVKGTIVHKVFGDILRGQNIENSIENRVKESKIELGILDKDIDDIKNDIKKHSDAIKNWLKQEKLMKNDDWRSEYTLISKNFGIKGRCDAIRQGYPVELKTGKNTKNEPRFHDKIQVGSYALLLEDQEKRNIDTGTVLYTGNSLLDRRKETGDLSVSKEFSISKGFLKFILKKRNEIAVTELNRTIPSGYEGEAICDYCFEQDHCLVVSGRLDQKSKAGKIGEKLPQNERDYFSDQYKFLHNERLAIYKEYQNLWEKNTGDKALIDLDLVNSKKQDNGKWKIKTKIKNQVSKIQAGDLVIASDGNPETGELAWVEKIGPDEAVIITDEFVDPSRLDVYPSEFTVDRMLTSVYEFILKEDERKKDIIFGRTEPRFDDKEQVFIKDNTLQNKAVRKAFNAKDFALIHGPPGTGKTYTITQLIQALISRGDRILISALTNRAVDNVLKILRQQGFNDFIRIGSETRISDDLLDVQVKTDYKKFKKANLIAATATTCSSKIMREQNFDVVIIDEAGQLTEPETLSAINLGDVFILVGDHKQLPSVTKTETNSSLFEKLIDRYPEATITLEEQYRMAQRIQSFPSKEFYDGNLRPANYKIASQTLEDIPNVSLNNLPSYLDDQVSFISIKGNMEGNTNIKEAKKIADIISELKNAKVPEKSIGIITPFRAQVSEINKRVPNNVDVDTVDRFQGSSKDVIIISFVVTDNLESPVFDDYRRLNVALTRAKKALILVGNIDTLNQDEVYSRMIDWSNII